MIGYITKTEIDISLLDSHIDLYEMHYGSAPNYILMSKNTVKRIANLLDVNYVCKKDEEPHYQGIPIKVNDYMEFGRIEIN